jgi:hypothetical protein
LFDQFDPEVTHDLEKWWVKVPHLLIKDAFKGALVTFPWIQKPMASGSNRTWQVQLHPRSCAWCACPRWIWGKSNEILFLQRKRMRRWWHSEH